MSGFLICGVAPASIRSDMPAPTPTFGPNLLVNGDMESGDPPTDWVAGANTQLAAVADARPGSAGMKSMRYTASGSATSVIATKVFNGTIGDWIRIDAWAKQGTNNNGGTVSITGTPHNAFTGIDKIISGWQQVRACTHRLDATPNTVFSYIRNTPAAVGYYGYWDDMVVNRIDPASMFSTQQSVAANTVGVNVYRPLVVVAGVTGFVSTHAGLVSRLDDPANPLNFVLVYTWAGFNTVRMDKCANGVYTNLINDTTARPQGSRLSISWSGNVATIFCNGVQVGAPQTIADASIAANVHHGLFSTHAANTFAGYVAA